MTALLLGLAVAVAAAAGAPRAQPRDRAFWKSIVESGYRVPDGESAMALLGDLGDLLGSPDPELRDGFGYGIAARWIYVDELLTPAELRELTDRWTANLKKGVGETGTDSVLLRSFSALDLSILAAQDNKSPFLDEAGFRKLLDAALRYLHDERDVRGYVPGKGWLHSAAHTADLLKFLARSPRLEPRDQARILEALGAKLDAPDGEVYRHGEDERMARAVLSILYRDDLDRTGFRDWLEDLGRLSTGLWEGELDPRRFAKVENAKNLLRCLFVLLSADDDATRAAALQPIRDAVLKTVTRL